MNRMEGFEKLWAARHDVKPEDMAQYRFESREGYRLPDMAAHYRTYCDVLDSIVIDLPESKLEGDLINNFSHEKMARNRGIDACRKAIEAAGLKVSN